MGNPSGFVGQFLEYGKNIGFARSNRFVVLIHGPSLTKPFVGYGLPKNSFVEYKQSITIDQKMRLALMCQTAPLAPKALMTQEHNIIGNGPNTSHAYAENVQGDFALEFLTSSDFFERIYFESWIDKIVNPGTHEVGLYSEYAKPWNVLVAHLPVDLNEYGNGADFNSVAYHLNNSTAALSQIYFVKYHQVYPTRVDVANLQHSTSSDPIRTTVTFKYLRWSDPVVDYMREQAYIRQELLNAQQGNINQNITKVQADSPIENKLYPNESLDKISPFESFGRMAKGYKPPIQKDPTSDSDRLLEAGWDAVGMKSRDMVIKNGLKYLDQANIGSGQGNIGRSSDG